MLVTDGRAAAGPLPLRASGAFFSYDVPVEESLRWGWFASAGSNALWDEGRTGAPLDALSPLLIRPGVRSR